MQNDTAMKRNYINLKSFASKAFMAAICIMLFTLGCKKDPFSYQEPIRQVLAYEMLKQDTSLTFAMEALEKANIAPTLNTYGPFTFFVPDNNAFRKFFASRGKSSIADFTEAELRTTMTYHILPARLKSSDFTQGPQSISTGGGDFLTLDISKGFKFNTIANGIANVYQTDIEFSNALVHKIDAVLNPPTQTIGQFLEQNKDRYSIMIGGLKKANLWDTLYNTNDNFGNRIRLTFFAESDDVLKAAGIQTLETMPLNQLDTLLRYHMIAGANFSASYTRKTEAKPAINIVERYDSTILTLNKEQWLYFDLAADKLINNTANFAASDVIMRNGTLQILDKHIEFNPGIKRTQLFHYFRTATSFAYGLPGITTNQAPAVNGSGRWRTFAERGSEFVFFDPDNVNDSMITIVRNVKRGKYRIEANFKSGGSRGDYQLMYDADLIGVPIFLGQGTLYDQKLVLGTYDFKTSGDKRLNFVNTRVGGFAAETMVLTPVY